MDFITTLLIAVGLAMDAFAVSLGVGTLQIGRSQRVKFRLAFHFGFFQGMMTLIGWLAGSTIAHLISQYDHWVAFILLMFVGIRIVRAGLNPKQGTYQADPSRGRMLIILSIATSIDALAVGLGLAMLAVNIYTASLTIALVTLGLSLAGLFIGYELGVRFGKRMEILGGLTLIGIGIRILLTHLL
jgi:putative Mn2+ efflux pump MntP